MEKYEIVMEKSYVHFTEIIILEIKCRIIVNNKCNETEHLKPNNFTLKTDFYYVKLVQIYANRFCTLLYLIHIRSKY